MVYVGNLEFAFKGMLMSHMVADTIEELHTMADNLGLKREWFQNKRENGIPHYDVSKGKKYQAIKLGAKEVSDRWIVDTFGVKIRLGLKKPVE